MYFNHAWSVSSSSPIVDHKLCILNRDLYRIYILTGQRERYYS